MKKTFFKSLPLALLLLISSCTGSRSITKDSNSASNSKSVNAALNYVRSVAQNGPKANAMTAKIKAELNMQGKSYSCGGSLRMKRDEVVQLSLTLLGFEVARAEFSPNNVLIIDRYNRRYVKAQYDDVDFLRQAGLNFYSLQALFWNELFVPGQQNMGDAAGRFKVASAGDHTLLTLDDMPKLNYDFLTITSSRLIDRLTVEGKQPSDRGNLVWRYSQFAKFSNSQFPCRMEINVKGTDAPDSGLTLTLSNLKADANWESHTTLSSKYTQMDAKKLLKNLFNR